MADYGASVDGPSGTQETPGFSLTKVVEDVSQHSFAQNEVLKGNQRILSRLQAALSETEKNAEAAEQQLRSNLREILILEAEMENLEQEMKVLQGHCASISVENTRLQAEIREEEEVAQAALEDFGTYRKKMEAHRVAIMQVSSQTEEHKALEERRALVCRLTQERDELRGDLGDPRENTTQRAKVEREVDALKEDVCRRRRTVAEKREMVQKELETQTHIKKDIEIQNKRCEAVIKRLRCQLSRAQAEHRQVSEEIHHTEKQLAELKRQLESPQDQ